MIKGEELDVFSNAFIYDIRFSTNSMSHEI